MTDKPILFSGPMVLALLEGRKTQTRRVLKPRKHASLIGGKWSDAYVLDPGNAAWLAEETPHSLGDRLWVREKHSFLESSITGCAAHVWYWADGSIPEGDYTFPRPSIHMPRWASRITLIVKSVRVERVQDISEADAESEGAAPVLVPPDGGSCPHVEGFRNLWDSLNAKRGYGWDSNPWVSVTEFEVHKGNIESFQKEGQPHD